MPKRGWYRERGLGHGPRAANIPVVSRRTFLKSAVALGAIGSGCLHRPPLSFGDASERDLVLLAIDAATSAGADYADARIVHLDYETIATREERITNVSSRDSHGIGVRALVGGSWGFAAIGELTRDSVANAGRRAAETAAANNRVAPADVELAAVDVFADGHWMTPHTIDPFDVSIEEKADLLLKANAAALAVDGAGFVSSSVYCVKDRRLVATTEGSIVDQTFLRISPVITVTAVSSNGRDFQSRTSNTAPAGRGWDYILDSGFAADAPRWAEEAVMKLSAKPVDPGVYDLVLHPTNLWLTIHESIGHPTELDRVFGYEANYAGTSFLSPPSTMLNQKRLGPEFMTMVGNRTEEGGLATAGWDDEAVPVESWPIIENGILVDYQTTREMAAWISEQTGITHSHACAYGQDWSSMPLQRMPNVSLMPGEEGVGEEDVIGATDNGIFIEGRGSYSIDQQRFNLQFSGQAFWAIKNGKKQGMLRDVAYTGRTPEFWNSMALLGGPETYHLGGSFNCAKGQPGQVRPVSHGCPIALFRGINVINTA